MRTLLCLAIVSLAAAAHAAVIGKATVTAEQAPVMSGKQVIATAKKGDTFDVTELKGDWFGVAPSQGWIHKSNVRYEPAGPAPAPAPAPAATSASAPTVNPAPGARAEPPAAVSREATALAVERMQCGKPLGIPMQIAADKDSTPVVVRVNLQASKLIMTRDLSLLDATGKKGAFWGVVGTSEDPLKDNYTFFDTDRFITGGSGTVALAFVMPKPFKEPLTFKVGAEEQKVRLLSDNLEWNVACLESVDEGVRLSGARLLALHKEQAAVVVPALKQALTREKVPEVRKAIEDALRKLGGLENTDKTAGAPAAERGAGPLWARIVVDFVPPQASDFIKSMSSMMVSAFGPQPAGTGYEVNIQGYGISMGAIAKKYGPAEKIENTQKDVGKGKIVNMSRHHYGPLVFDVPDGQDCVHFMAAPGEWCTSGLRAKAEDTLKQAGASIGDRP
jgi:hypothetical protein